MRARTYQAAFEDLGAALQNFSSGRREGRRVGFPDFRKKGRSTESVLFQRPAVLDSRNIRFHRQLGSLRTKESMRKLCRLLERDEHARITRSRIKHTPSGRWYVSFTVKRSEKSDRRPRRPLAVGGMDAGLSRAARSPPATSSTTRARSSTRSGSSSACSAGPTGAAAPRTPTTTTPTGQRRRAFGPGFEARGSWTSSGVSPSCTSASRTSGEQAHLITTALVREFGILAVETLAVKNMLKDKRLARHISDVGWGLIVEQLKYKTKWAGSILYRADRFFPSSKTCSDCDTVKAKLGRSERVFRCDNPTCGLVLDRDVNAARNLAKMGLRFAQAEGMLDAYVARTGRVTRTAVVEGSRRRATRGGLVSPGTSAGQRSVKREDCSSGQPSRAGNSPALAI